MKNVDLSKYITASEYADTLNISRQLVVYYITTKRLTGILIGGRYFVPKTAKIKPSKAILGRPKLKAA